MALRDQPYIPLYVQDYLTDEKLNMCSAATQGVYIKIMCVFHKSEPYGGILLKQKDKQNEQQILNFALRLARLLPFTHYEVAAAVSELIEEGVLEIDGDLLFQKRMVKDGKISDSRAKAGKSGGEKSLGKNKFASDFAQAKSKAKQTAKTKQKPEYENEDESEVVIENEDERKRGLGKNIENPFTENFITVWNQWKDYKRTAHRFQYKTEESENIALAQLAKSANFNEEQAIEMIHHSIAQGYKGIFAPNQKTQNNGGKQIQLTDKFTEWLNKD